MESFEYSCDFYAFIWIFWIFYEIIWMFYGTIWMVLWFFCEFIWIFGHFYEYLGFLWIFMNLFEWFVWIQTNNSNKLFIKFTYFEYWIFYAFIWIFKWLFIQFKSNFIHFFFSPMWCLRSLFPASLSALPAVPNPGK